MNSSPLAERWDGLWLDCHLATLCDNGAPYGAVANAALAWKDGRITFAGPLDELPGSPEHLAGHVESMGGAWITPGHRARRWRHCPDRARHARAR